MMLSLLKCFQPSKKKKKKGTSENKSLKSHLSLWDPAETWACMEPVEWAVWTALGVNEIRVGGGTFSMF